MAKVLLQENTDASRGEPGVSHAYTSIPPFPVYLSTVLSLWVVPRVGCRKGVIFQVILAPMGVLPNGQ